MPASEQYAEINVQPGYQLLCGKKALQYVRYRHTDTDLVRSARQQDFISAARQRISVQDLVFDQSGLIDIFTKYTTSDINDKETMLQVMKLFLASRNASIKEVHFPAELGPSYVYATPAGDPRSGQPLPRDRSQRRPPRLARRRRSQRRSSSEKSKKGGKKKRTKPRKPQIAKPKPPGSDGLVPAREAGEAEAKIAARRVSGRFPIFYPTRLPVGAYYVESNPLRAHPGSARLPPQGRGRRPPRGLPDGRWWRNCPDGAHYFGVQGIRGWEDPPILNNPSLTKTINGREYDIYVDGDRVKLIAWHRGENSYWIANDLLQTLTNDQMVGMARSADVIVPRKKPKQGRSTE